MANRITHVLLSHVRELAGIRHAEQRSDPECLQCFVNWQDQAAFAALVRRHGPMVLSVCRRVLRDQHAAEDVFQAAFIVLARKAGVIRKHDSIASWLHGVAHRLALKANSDILRRQFHERQHHSPTCDDPPANASWREYCVILDEELGHLSDRYRAPLVLCYLQGRTRDEAAHQLGWSLRTFERRLEQGRNLLRSRLLRRGVTLSASLFAVALGPSAPAAVPPLLLAATIQTAMQRIPVLTVRVATLAKAGIGGTGMIKVKTVLGLLLATSFFFAGVVACTTLKPEQPMKKPSAAKESVETKPEKDEPPRVDCQGDPLPPDAVARMGTTRFRHGDTPFALAFTPDGRQLVSADWYGTHLWETASGKEIRRIGPRFKTSLRSLSLSPDGKIVASAEHHKGLIQIWDVTTGILIREFMNGPDNDDRFCSVLISPDGTRLASYAGKKIRLWDLASGQKLRDWIADEQRMHCLVFTPDGKKLISGGDEKTIVFWDAASGKELRRIEDHPGTVNALALTADGKMLASLGSTKHEFNNARSSSTLWLSDNLVHLWDVASGKKARRLEAKGKDEKKGLLGSHPNAISHFVFSRDGKTLATAGQDRTIRIWDVAAGKELSHWDSYWITSLAFSPDSNVLASGSNDKTIRLWNPTDGAEIREQPGHRDGIQFVVFSADGQKVATASSDRTVRVWDARTGKELHVLRSRHGEIRPLGFSVDGKTLTTTGVSFTVAGADKKARVWDLATGTELREFDGSIKGRSCTVSPDGKTWAAVAQDKKVVLWDGTTGKKHPTAIQHENGIGYLAFSPNGRRLFTWCGDRRVHVWDLATGKDLRQFGVGPEGDSHHVAFSPDGRWVAHAGQDRAIELYDLTTGRLVRRITDLPDHWVSCLSFSPDSRTLASTGTYDPTISLWEVATGSLRYRLTGHQGRIFTLVFAADGNHLASGSDDTQALLWDLTGARGGRSGRTAALSTEERAAYWTDLGSGDGERAYRAIRTLVIAPGPTVAFLKSQIRAIGPVDSKLVARMIADLDSDDFDTREIATRELQKRGDAVESALRRAITDQPSAELRRRAENLLAKIDAERSTTPSFYLHTLRAVEILEKMGSTEAIVVLKTLAEGAPEAWLTGEATESLERLTKRRGAAR